MTVKFIHSEKATNFCEISTVDLSYVVTVKSKVEISQNFVAFSEYMNFIRLWYLQLSKLYCVKDHRSTSFDIMNNKSSILNTFNVPNTETPLSVGAGVFI